MPGNESRCPETKVGCSETKLDGNTEYTKNATDTLNLLIELLALKQERLILKGRTDEFDVRIWQTSFDTTTVYHDERIASKFFSGMKIED